MAMTQVNTGSGPKLLPAQVHFFNRQVASMARLQMPLAKGVKILAREVDEGNFRVVLESVQRDLEEGKPLSEALAKFPGSFSKLYLEVLRTGERSGNFAAILDELTSYSETMVKIRNRISTAMLYPALIATVSFLFVSVYLTSIAPRTKEMITSSVGGGEIGETSLQSLNILTRFVFLLSDLALNPFVSGVVLLGIAALVFVAVRMFLRMGESYDDFLFRIPLFGKLFQRATLMKMTRTMRELLMNGLSMVNTLRLTANIVGENRVKSKLLEIAGAVEEGAPFSRNLASGDLFPDTMVWKLQMAEEKGIVEDALRELSHEFESEVDARTNLITNFLSPFMLILMALVVLVLFAATFGPLFRLMRPF